MEQLKVTRDPTFDTYWNVRGEDGGLRAVLYNPAKGYWHVHMWALSADPSVPFSTKAACLGYLHGYQAGWTDALTQRDTEDAQQGFLLEGT